MNWRDRHGVSDSQANANALAVKDRPYRQAHEASVRAPREPETLRDLKREFRDAYAAELAHELQVRGPEIEDGSALGTPAWTGQFRSYVTGSAHARDAEGYFVWPHRAAIADMATDKDSAISRNATALLYLMQRHGDFDHVAAWKALLGKFREAAAYGDFLNGTADPIAIEALRRWWRLYSREPRRATAPAEVPYCEHPTPECPHGVLSAVA